MVRNIIARVVDVKCTIEYTVFAFQYL